MIVAGLDPAFANFGMVAADLTQSRGHWSIDLLAMELIQTKGDGKQRVVRKSNENLRRGRELFKGLHAFLQEHSPELVFVEVPSGAQNANAAMGLGLAVGILASIGVPVIEVSPDEIKSIFTKKRESVPKSVIVDWALKNWPAAPWMRHTRDGRVVTKRKGKPPSTTTWKKGDPLNDNEHLADATASIYAGISTPTFLQLQAMRGLNEVSMPHHDRHPHGGQPIHGIPVGAVPVDQRANQKTRRKVLANPW